MKDRFILACQEYFVKRRAEAQATGQPLCMHPRIHRETLPEELIRRRLKALGRLIVRNNVLNKPIRVPALNGAEWGHLLRSLETVKGLA
ncbi:hypothetical protein FHU10_5287 [Serratia fonticola]|uniref:Uncharacterized protein n=1 Tax=Serratia fonticola TaxID=47917 RepID=A0A559SGV5_SERFO|nr:hypothetical protein [Serratia fonticola]TQI77313.1 hypothetical protein FHU09_5311 [Serratia fonticola]TQI93642.1 hypothetical protein FHU11_5335 [Serratia fonticola]TVZ61591.1 hypothetical protein FHU10_5287 [Serratia fonticola]